MTDFCKLLHFPVVKLSRFICLRQSDFLCFQVVYVTATLPLLLLAIMFFRGVHLDGFQHGLALLFVPKVMLFH